MFDGVDTSGALLGALSGHKAAGILSSGTDVFIQFRSDPISNKHKGFRIEFAPG